MDDENQIVIKEGITLYFIHPDHFELAKPQAGDMARCKQHGTIFVIDDIRTYGNAGSLYYEKKGSVGCQRGHQGKNLCGLGVPEDMLELIPGGGKKNFEVGNTVKIIKRGYDCSNANIKSCCDNYIGKEGIIIKPSHSIKENHSFVRIPGASRCSGFANDCLELISKGGSKMSEYEELKKRIEEMDGECVTLKEMDDLLQEIYSKSLEGYRIGIPLPDNHIDGDVRCRDIRIFRYDPTIKLVETFDYSSQCEKMEALRRAFKWLLEHSSIKKDKKQEEIDKLKKELEDFRERTDKEIKKLESSQ